MPGTRRCKLSAVGPVRATAVGLVVLATAAACGSGGLSDLERAWCVDHHPVVLDTMDVLYPWHWEGNEEYKAEARPVFARLEAGELDQHEAYLLLAQLARGYWPEEYEQGCRAAFADR